MLTAKEAQAMLRMSSSTFYFLVRSGVIPHYRFSKRVLRFEEAQLQEYKKTCLIPTRVTKEITVTRVNVSSTGEKSPLREYFERSGRKLKDKP